MNAPLVRTLFSLTTLVFLVSGCAGFRENLLAPGVTPSRQERSAQAIRDFEERRDSAQLAAALDRFNQGDAARAESMITALVNRRPEFTEARLRLAEVLWSRGDSAAEQHLRTILQSNPNHAEAHHALGLLLSASDRNTEARQHLSRAVALEPDNEIYATTYQSQAGG